MKVYCMCNRCVTLVKKKKHSRCFGGKNLLSSDSQMCFISIWTYGKALLPYEYRFLCFSFLYIYFYICTWLEFWKQKENLSPFFYFYAVVGSKNKTWPVGAFCQQPKCVCLCGNPISQALDFSLWMSCSLSHMVSFSVYSILSSRGTCFDRVHAQHRRALPTF